MFFRLFLEWLDEQMYLDPQKALLWAEKASELVVKIPGKAIEGRSLQVLALVRLASAYRRVGNTLDASSTYEKAQELAREPIDALAQIELDRRLAILLACQGKTGEAVDLARGSVEKLRQIGSPLLAGALVGLSFTLKADGQPERAIVEALTEVLGLPKERTSANRRARATAAKNLAVQLESSNNPAGAIRFLKKARKLTPSGSWEGYVLLWADGAIHARLGSHARAERLYLRSMNGFERLRLPYEAALLGIDLAGIYHLTGDHAAMEAAAGRAFEILRNLSGASTKVLQAFSLWRDAVVQKRWTGAVPEIRTVLLAKFANGGRCRRR